MKYQFRSRVRFSESDENQVMTLYSLLNYLQDCATFHGEDTGVGIRHNLGDGVAWMIADMQLGIVRYPVFNEEIIVSTWADRFHGMIGHRCFSIETAEHEMLVLANSNWVFMNVTEQLPEKVPDAQIEAYGVHPEWKITEDLGKRKIRFPSGTEAETDKPAPFPIRESHLDANHHVNNAQYVRMAGRYIPEDFQVRRLRAEWKKQARLGDVLRPEVRQADGAYYVQLTDAAGEPYFTAEFSDREFSL